ncbi:unnamed protein product [Arctia plantaginis]|uniref:Allorecognition 2 n=1 Tax=Arctia plantaginis TaxID=874455 RepID=A0A8S0YTK0_ARCPL|nr:unnamed protein product [Arctia plantaginis]
MKNLIHKVVSFLCFFCSTSPTDVVSDSVNVIKVYNNSIKEYFYEETQNKHYKYIENWYWVSSDHPVTIIFVDYRNTTVVSCTTAENRKLNIEKKYEEKAPKITIDSDYIITGTWSCELWNNYNRTTEFIYFRLREKDKMPPQQILVNHIDLILTKEKDIYTAEYFYEDGEKVHVDCISSDETCTVQMSNPFSDENGASAWGFGFPVNLHSYDNQTKIKCISDCSGIKSTVEVTFVELQKYPHEINIKINNQDITKNVEGREYVNYAYFYNNEQITITCDTNKNDIATSISCENCYNETEKELRDRRTEVTFVPNMISDFSCVAKKQDGAEVVIKVYIRFQLVSCRDDSQLTVQGLTTEVNNVPKESSTEGPHSTVSPIVDHGDHNDQENYNNGDDNKEKYENYQYKLWIPAVAVLMLIVVLCVLIVKSKTKKRNSRNRREPEHNYDYCMVNDITPHYPAQSEIEYAVPEGDMQENTLYQRSKDFYAKVIPKSLRQRNKQQSIDAATNRSKEFVEDAGPDFLVMNSLYSSACLEPDDRSGPTKSVSDDQGTSMKASTNLEMLSDVYSEPINKKETKEDTYTNVTGEPHYSNKMGGYCVYPTYSEPHIKK